MIEQSSKAKTPAALGSAAGALLASTCCILPLLLVSLGVTGTWIGGLTALDPYKYAISAVTAGFLATGFWVVYRKQDGECTDGCRTPTKDRFIKLMLWSATGLILLSLTVDLWAPLFY